ncbi:hypothetical protein TNCV_127701 [Trichonephila clavipes]|nr:hypothetical protein TNCV_127701 [Trichonephila clavipes]
MEDVGPMTGEAVYAGLNRNGISSTTYTNLLKMCTDWLRRQSGIHRVQCIGAHVRHPSWHGRKAGRPRQYPGQARGGILLKCHTDHQIGTSVHAPQRPMVTYYDGHSSSWPSWIVVPLSLSLKFEDYLTLGIPLR